MKTVIEKLGSILLSKDYARDTEAENKWEEKAEQIVKEYLPSGSGFDSGTKILWDKTTSNKIVLQADFHHINENGYYDGWTEHKVTVRPGFCGIDISVSGRNRNDIKHYILDTFQHDLEKTISEIPVMKPSCQGAGVE